MVTARWLTTVVKCKRKLSLLTNRRSPKLDPSVATYPPFAGSHSGIKLDMSSSIEVVDLTFIVGITLESILKSAGAQSVCLLVQDQSVVYLVFRLLAKFNRKRDKIDRIVIVSTRLIEFVITYYSIHDQIASSPLGRYSGPSSGEPD
jgi:hypothetical protein